MSMTDQILNQNKGNHEKKETKGILGWLNENLEKTFLSIFLFLIIIFLTYQAIGRYVLVDILGMNPNLSWSEEVSRFLFIWMTYLAIPISIRNRDMIRVDAVVSKMPERWQKIFWATADFFFLVLGAAIFYYGTRHVMTLIKFPQTTAVLGISYASVYLILPIGFGLILLRLCQDIYALKKECPIKDIAIGFAIGLVILLPAIIGFNAAPAVWLFGYFVVLLVIGVPIAISLGLAALITMFASATLPISYIATQAFTSLDNITLLAIPLFIASGNFMGEGGLSERLLSMADKMLGGLPGGFGIATIFTCMLFAAMSGSGPATVAAIGSLTIPAMVQRGYDKAFSAALVAAAGSIGVMIPPSNPFVVYGVTSSSSIGSLFMAGITPGILVGLILMGYTVFMAKRYGWKGSKTDNYGSAVAKAVWNAKWALMVPIIILGGIYSGLMTPTESAAVAAFYGLIVGAFLYKGITKNNFQTVLVDSTTTSAIIILLMAMATIFGNILTLENIPSQIAAFILGVSSSKIVILLLINLLLLVVGCFMEALAAIIILTPLLLPIVTKVGVDPVHFGVIMVVNLAIGFITPPVGVDLFVAAGVSRLRLEEVSKAVIPMMLLMLIVLLILTYVPETCMWLPHLLND